MTCSQVQVLFIHLIYRHKHSTVIPPLNQLPPFDWQQSSDWLPRRGTNQRRRGAGPGPNQLHQIFPVAVPRSYFPPRFRSSAEASPRRCVGGDGAAGRGRGASSRGGDKKTKQNSSSMRTSISAPLISLILMFDHFLVFDHPTSLFRPLHFSAAVTHSFTSTTSTSWKGDISFPPPAITLLSAAAAVLDSALLD